MTVADEEFAREFARLSATFVAQLPRQVQALSDDLGAYQATPHDAALFDTLSHKVHQLKGAGSTFGCSSISDLAMALEQCLATRQSNAADGSATDFDAVDAALEALRGEASRVYDESAHRGQAGALT